MALTDTRIARRKLDAWARDTGHSDWQMYLNIGGTIAACHDDLIRRRIDIDLMLDYLAGLSQYKPPPTPVVSREPVIGPEALARLEAEQAGEPIDGANAHPQGDDGWL